MTTDTSRGWLLLLLVLALALPLGGCEKDESPGGGNVEWEFLDQELGIQVMDMDLEDREDVGEDEIWYCDATVVVAGTGRVITVEESDWPILSDENDADTVTDYDTGNERIYEADQALENFVVRDGDDVLTVLVNADDTWVVDGEEAADAEEAAFLAVQSPIIADASLHGLAAMYAFMSERADAESSRTICGIGYGGDDCSAQPNQAVTLRRAALEDGSSWEDLEEQEDDVVEILREVIRLRLEDESDDGDDAEE